MQKKVLIIDDEPEALGAVEGALKEAGYLVYTARNASQGWDRIKECLPDLILLDLVLPDESGFSLAHEIKSSKEYRDIPIVAVSYKREAVDKHIAAKLGVVEYLEKPIDKDKLLLCVRDILV